MSPITEWKTRRIVATGLVLGAVFNGVVYWVEWGKDTMRLSEFALFIGLGAMAGAALLYSVWLLNKNTRR